MSKTDHKKLYRSLMDDYMGGRMEESLAEKVRGWLPESEHPGELDEVLKEEFSEFVREFDTPAASTLASWEKICRELGFERYNRKDSTKKGSLGKIWLRIAAAVIPLLLAGGYLMLKYQDGQKPASAVVAVNYTAGIEAPEEGKKRTVLPDGSQVILNAGSILEYDSVGYGSARNVRLHGEAFFTVVKDDSAPFRVDAGDMTVTVLGTEFNVKTAGQDGFSEVSLFTGSVEVRAAGRTELLQPDQQLIYGREEDIMIVKDFDTAVVGNWRLRLDMNNISLPQALTMIQDHFGMPVVIEGSLAGSNRIRVSFKEATVDETMDIIRMITGGFDYRIENDTIIVTANR